MNSTLGLFPLGTRPFGWSPLVAETVAPVAPLLFKHELAAWLRIALGVPVHAYRRPEREKPPALTYAVIDGASPPLLTGPRDFAWLLIQFDAWATSASGSELLARRLYDALTGRHDQIGAARNVVALPKQSRSSFEPFGDASDNGLYRESRDYWISWTDPAPAG